MAALADQVDDFRRSLWSLASARPQVRASRAASRARAALGDTLPALHALRAELEAAARLRALE